MSNCCGNSRGKPWSLYISAVILCLALVFVVAQGASVAKDEFAARIADRFSPRYAAGRSPPDRANGQTNCRE